MSSDMSSEINELRKRIENAELLFSNKVNEIANKYDEDHKKVESLEAQQRVDKSFYDMLIFTTETEKGINVDTKEITIAEEEEQEI